MALVAALGLLVAGTNFGCAPKAQAPAVKPACAYCLTPPAPGTPSGPAKAGATVNRLCPINGAPFNPNDVPDVLVRYYKGMKVGFCCGGHPEMWDKLSDAEKDAKLAVAMGK